jgi:hypothetical protein
MTSEKTFYNVAAIINLPCRVEFDATISIDDEVIDEDSLYNADISTLRVQTSEVDAGFIDDDDLQEIDRSVFAAAGIPYPD